MANTNFKIFAESASDTMTDSEYSADPQRIGGVEPGLAKSNLHNKLYRQATIMAAAIAQVMAERGFDAMDDDYNGLVAGLKQAFVYSVNDKKPGADGNVDCRLLSLNDVYPVGSIYMSVNATDPSVLFEGTTWQQIAGGRCLIGADANYKAGTMGGDATVTLALNQIPAHGHTATAGSNGTHKHNRGTMEITGTFGADDRMFNSYSGAFAKGHGADTGSQRSEYGNVFDFRASRSWTGETSEAGNHSHSITISSAGGGQAHNNMQPYLVVYIWKRIK